MKEKLHPDYSHLIGERVNITVDNKHTYYNKELFFAGTSMLGKEVITTGCDRMIIEVKNWKDIKIEKV